MCIDKLDLYKRKHDMISYANLMLTYMKVSTYLYYTCK